MSPSEYRARHPEAGAVFDRARTGRSRAQADAALAAYDFGRFGSVVDVDVGGGQGAFLAALLARHHGTRGVLFDQAHVVARAQPLLEAAGVADRCRVDTGSFPSQSRRGAMPITAAALLCCELGEGAWRG